MIEPVSQCKELAKDQFPGDPEPDGRIHWRINREMEIAEQLALDILTHDVGKVWYAGALRDAIYTSPTWDIAESSCISLALNRMEKQGKIEVDKEGIVFLP
jgi:hypothetical protein